MQASHEAVLRVLKAQIFGPGGDGLLQALQGQCFPHWRDGLECASAGYMLIHVFPLGSKS